MTAAEEPQPAGRPVEAPVPGPRPARPDRAARTRIVLAEVSRSGSRADRTRSELAQQTRVGEALVQGLMRAQLALALRLACWC